jgi:small subunit ribosomal protein S8
MSQVSTDPIADMLTRIRNAIRVNQSEISLPYSKIKYDLATILLESDFIAEIHVEGEGTNKRLQLLLAKKGRNSLITEIQRLSKPGRRSYTKAKEIPVIKNGRGIVIISTSRGIMAGGKAKQEQIGGELICRVY